MNCQTTEDLRIFWRLSTILSTGNKSVQSNLFWYVTVCIFWKCIQYNRNLKKISLGQKTLRKIPSFLFRSNWSQLYLYTSWNTWFIPLKLCVGFFIFDSASILWNLYFCYTKSMESFTLKRHSFFQNKNHRTAKHSFADFWFLNCTQKFGNSMISAWVWAPEKLIWRLTF